MKTGIAVKGFIVNKEKLLLIKRRPDDIHKPGAWEIPGGRLEIGEDPYLGLKREVKEETGLEIKILQPLSVNYFTRDDGQVITGIVFVCTSEKENIKLSEEHTEFEWIEIKKAKEKLVKPMHKEIDRFFELEMDKKIKTLKEPNYKL